ncbi:MAG TPA: iron uptake transporter permease EfeU [Actinomycetota bacterium]|nr:iron uptake transporter permease EfeU [Actinomycetota bacterium]
MLPTFVIALREGVEASLVVGIVAAFLGQQGRRDALRWVWIGVGLATALCLAVGIGLRLVGENLPQAQQEGLEASIALVAVGMVTYMIVWMRRHARGIKRTLEGEVAEALAQGSVLALVAMAFFAVLREGVETAVFLLAVFQSATNPGAASLGAILGLVAAVVLGYLLYKGGLRINLARFFRVTGAVLTLVAAGLVASALYAAHEATWFNVLQDKALDLSWLVAPGSIRAALLTGMLGLRPEPTVGETLGWLLYLVPVGLYLLWPDRWRTSTLRRRPAPVTTVEGTSR